MCLSRVILSRAMQDTAVNRTLDHKRRLLEAAKRYALEIADGKRPRLVSLTRSDKLESYGEAVALLGFARAQASPP